MPGGGGVLQLGAELGRMPVHANLDRTHLGYCARLQEHKQLAQEQP
jgi:hypothetical protein